MHVTALRELHFQCYSIAIPGLGIAIAAAVGLAKVAIVSVTIFVKVTESFFKMTKNPPQKLKDWCSCCCSCCNGKVCNIIYIAFGMTLLMIVAFGSPSATFIYLIHLANTDPITPILHVLYYMAYGWLPVLLAYPLMYVMIKLLRHCKQGEYVSFADDQRPLQSCDWDEGQDESVVIEQAWGESGNTSGASCNETEETRILGTNTNAGKGYGETEV